MTFELVYYEEEKKYYSIVKFKFIHHAQRAKKEKINICFDLLSSSYVCAQRVAMYQFHHSGSGLRIIRLISKSINFLIQHQIICKATRELLLEMDSTCLLAAQVSLFIKQIFPRKKQITIKNKSNKILQGIFLSLSLTGSIVIVTFSHIINCGMC